MPMCSLGSSHTKERRINYCPHCSTPSSLSYAALNQNYQHFMSQEPETKRQSQQSFVDAPLLTILETKVSEITDVNRLREFIRLCDTMRASPATRKSSVTRHTKREMGTSTEIDISKYLIQGDDDDDGQE
jgi:hypothetical protein